MDRRRLIARGALGAGAAAALAAPALSQPMQHDAQAPAPPAVPASLADWAKGARLYPGLGSF
ncbi:MAG TPA: hypothetical protein VE684_04585, partial [Crenalkalicoccus sp.]|nr:hypothetical protein [Crenalkalicoccus sp.]